MTTEGWMLDDMPEWLRERYMIEAGIIPPPEPFESSSMGLFQQQTHER